MKTEEVLGIFVGVLFLILGLALLVRYKKLSSHKYFRFLIVFIGIILVAFAVYIAFNSFYWYE